MSKFDTISKILGILIAERESYSYVDKIGYAPSKDMLLHYLKEAFRDYNSLLTGGFDKKSLEEEAKKINIEYAERELMDIENISEEDRKAIREVSSLIASKALLVAAKLRG